MAQRPAVPELALANVSFMAPMILSVPGDVIAAVGSVVTCLLLSSGYANRKAGCSSRKESAAQVQLEWGTPRRKTSEHSSGGLGYK